MTSVEAPGAGLYSSPRGLYGFQEDGIARAYLALRDGSGLWIANWDTGTGKTHLAMALAAMMFEDGLIDLALVVCEKNKVTDWARDFGTFTSLDARKHYGQGRMQRLAKKGMPQVMVSVYETIKADAVRFVREPGKRGTSVKEGPLLESLTGKRVLVVYDESTKIRNRGVDTYRAHKKMIDVIAKGGEVKVLELTATPIERDYEDAFNQARIAPNSGMPTVGQFEKVCVAGRDPWGRARYNQQGVSTLFLPAYQGRMHRVRKSDPEVRAEFPKQVEEAVHVEMGPEQASLYEMVRSLGLDPDGEPLEEPVPGLWTLLRQIAGYPGSVALSEGSLARMVTEEVGVQRLMDMPSAKAEELVRRMEPLILGQGAKAVAFTFFGQSVLPLLQRDLEAKKMRVFPHHGGMTSKQQDEVKDAFRACPEPAIFLTSDAGARGLNLQQASYVTNYELPLTHAGYTQRINRVHRIDSAFDSVTCLSLVLDDTVEDGIGLRMLSRNEQQDATMGDTSIEDEASSDAFISAADRRAMLKITRGRK